MRNVNRERYRPEVEGLESLVALSGGVGAMHGGAVAAALAPISHRQAPVLALSGTVHGGYMATSSNPDVGKTYRMGVAGRINPLGQTGESGQINTTGFIANGMATGTMTISAPKGSVKLQLTGPSQPGFAALPSKMTFQIVGGTRAFAKATGSGSVAISLSSSVFSSGFGLITLSFRPASTTSA
jgi:hypothetical protein